MDTLKAKAVPAAIEPTMAEKFNTYRFAHYKAKVIDLLKGVTAVSVRTMVVVRGGWSSRPVNHI